MISSDSILKNIDVVLAHQFTLDDNHRCERYISGRKIFGLCFAISGSAEYRFASGEKLTVNAGQGILLSDKSAYTIFTKEYKHYTVNFYAEDVDDSFFDRKDYFMFFNSAEKDYLSIFSKIVSDWQEKCVGYKMRVVSQVYKLISFIIEDYLEKNHSLSYREKRLLPAKEWLERNFTEHVSIKDLAKMCDMSQTNFRREFLAVHLKSVTKFRNDALISYAKELLTSGYCNVSETAYRCGFLDVNYFVRFFKSKTGVAPGKYREELLYLATEYGKTKNR